MARILVIDDDEDLLEFVHEVLEAAGHDVRTAADGEAGIRLASARAVDLVITDIFMPGSDGIETIFAFREVAPPVKIVAMSGGGKIVRDDLLPAAQLLGAVETIQKPFEPQALLSTVTRILRAPARFAGTSVAG